MKKIIDNTGFTIGNEHFGSDAELIASIASAEDVAMILGDTNPTKIESGKKLTKGEKAELDELVRRGNECLNGDVAKLDEANAIFAKVIQLYPHRSEGYWGITRVNNRFGFSGECENKLPPKSDKQAWNILRLNSRFGESCDSRFFYQDKQHMNVLALDTDFIRAMLLAESVKVRSYYFNEAKKHMFFHRGIGKCRANQYYSLGSYCFGMNEKKASYAWFYLASLASHPASIHNIGYSYVAGNCFEADDRKAYLLFGRAADLGHRHAQYSFALCYENGSGVEKNEKMAAKYYELAANNGHVRAMCDIADYYRYGIGIEKDIDKAIHYLRMAADNENLSALFRLAECYESEDGKADPKEALMCYREIACESEPAGWYKTGVLIYQGYGDEGDDELAVYYLEECCDIDFLDASYYLGEFYYLGRGVEKNIDEAIRLYKIAKNKGCELAASRLEELGIAD